jgi:DNA-binding transcriptional regulator YhcF (GntR family)
MLTITIDRAKQDPVYEQVADQVRQFVASGDLTPGATLPSVRQLARDLGVNLNTVARAYRVLDSEGFLIIRDRAGVTVAAPCEDTEPAARARLRDELRSTLARLRQAGMATDHQTRDALREFLSSGLQVGENGRENSDD